ncbi:MAG: hypothetical protein ACFCU1_03055 [Sumerlaeia bacterium]
MANKTQQTEEHNAYLVEEAPATYLKASQVNPFKELRTRYRFKQNEMHRLAGISLRNLSALETNQKQPTEQDQRKLREMEALLEELAEIIQPTEIHRWMTKANPYFKGATPLQLVERGDIDQLWRLIWRMKHGIPLG